MDICFHIKCLLILDNIIKILQENVSRNETMVNGTCLNSFKVCEKILGSIRSSRNDNLFSCKDAAQQVLMSLSVHLFFCLSVSKVEILPSYSSQCNSVQFQNVPECSRMFQNVPECSRIIKNVQECSFKNFQECSRIFQKVPEHFRTFQNA